MKQISLLASIVLLLIAAAFFMRDRSARSELRNSAKQIATLSNDVARANTIMVMHGVTNSQLQQDIARYLERLSGLSNRLARTTEDLRKSRGEHDAVRAELQRESMRAAGAEARVAELEAEARTASATLEIRNNEIARLTTSLRQAETGLAEFHSRVQKAEAEVVRLQLDHTDEAALRAHLKRLRNQPSPVGFAKTPHLQSPDTKGAKALTARVDSHAKGYYLQIQADGSVKLIPPLEAAGAAR